MIRALRELGSALAYYTILPAGTSARDGAPDGAALAWLPLIGALVGSLAGLAGYAAFVWLQVPWAFLIAWSVAIALTGALHVDGFLDACDALFAAAAPQRRREILKDVHHGTFALVGMAVAIGFWLAALAAITPARYPLVLAFCGAAARLAVMPVALTFPYASGGTMARTFASRPSIVSLIFNVALLEALAWTIAPWALALPPAAMLVALAVAWWASRRLDGAVTGDIYGAAIVTTEVLLLLAVGVCLKRFG